MENPPSFRKKHEAQAKKKDKGTVPHSKKHVRIELEKLQRQAYRESRACT
jgi:hypothetical protein